MRLSLFEVSTILMLKNKIFGKDSIIYLFGSRVDDSKKGGDIDLYLENKVDKSCFEKKIEFLTDLQEIIGEQKIDLVIARDNKRAIEIEAKEKGIELNIEAIKLQRYFNECNKHLQRIEEAYSDLAVIFPLSVNKYKALTKGEVQAIDQYLFRFAKLQDAMGEKVFKRIIQQYEQKNDALPLIDVLNKLEKFGFLNSSKEWINLRKIRNEITHQYDDEPEDMTLAINNIVSQKDSIKEIYLNLKDKYNVIFNANIG